MKVFGINEISAEYVSLLFGVLLIPLTYFLGTMLFDRRVGLCAALFMWIDPVTVMTSQKIWPDTAMNFFILLSILFFVKAIKSKKENYFILCGLACGLALLTKYTAILIWITIILITFQHQRRLFQNKVFILSLALPFLFLLPWFYWNYLVYGTNFLMQQRLFHQNRLLNKVIIIFVLLTVIIVKGIWALRNRPAMDKKNRLEVPKEISRQKANIAIGFFLLGGILQNIFHSLQLFYLPRTSWVGSVFALEPPTFYIGQLIEYSFIYFFAFAALFIERKDFILERALLRYGIVIVLIFFTAWRAFQCRYILAIIPLLVILGIELIFRIFERIERIDTTFLYFTLKIFFILILCYIFAKTLYIDAFLSFPNDMCYY
jgi:hypothetical protein